MRFVKPSILLAILLMSSIARSAELDEKATPVVLGYFLVGQGIGADSIHYGLYTHLCVAFAEVTAQNEPKLPSDPAVPELLTKAHAAGVKVLISLGGDGSGSALNRLSANARSRTAFIEKFARSLCDSGYDGCDVDWEFPGRADAANVAVFVHDLAVRLREIKPDAVLTMAVPCTAYYGQYFPMESMVKDVTFLQVMTYDVHGPWNDGGHLSHAGHNSPLFETNADAVDGADFSFAKSLEYWQARKVPKSKLNIGIACYGHGFAAAALGATPKRASRYPEIAYREAVKLQARSGWKTEWDAEAGVPYLVNPGLGELVSFDNEKSAQAKGAWALEKGVRGIFFWEVTQDLVDGRNVLVEAARSGFAH